jgi:hypothetical protein
MGSGGIEIVRDSDAFSLSPTKNWGREEIGIWGEGRGEGLDNFPLTPTLSPTMVLPVRSHRSWGRGGKTF